ncbi:hypothetical protein CH272_28295 [Rhodococcus sp. 05-340-1]|uniref:hypothetical protein n=1 Tax=Nocardiaceae TaxID=85025 RepID=UPI00050C2E12|nr:MULTISPECIES: hypothetical protein [Rhodococcus]OZC87838.1 hypothetical protein CH254_14940 [Rhodococcus sp. 06-412-2C]OZC96487.1 hypothetical protein CH279_15105 [Rhodococcus sp. 06-412-2B]OZD65281.1 hypothetical protein CH271_19730 [Rhodococcus sp. 05-340-2]OZD69315.1 hypothetical protein CH272_28295 [Rhodococcus sp. 05-340-1]OZD86722.1 hypothetical protein CH273_01015 [Rhodococcus sp. 05-339-2]
MGRRPIDWSRPESLYDPALAILDVIDTKKDLSSVASALGINTQAVEDRITKVERLFGSSNPELALVKRNVDGDELSLSARGQKMRQDFADIIDKLNSLHENRPAQHVRVLHLPHHTPAVAPAALTFEKVVSKNASDGSRPSHYRTELKVLGEHHRAPDHFMARGIRPMVAGYYDVVVGLPFVRDAKDSPQYKQLRHKIHTEDLYRAWLEVQVDEIDQRSEYPIEDLRGVPILTAPKETRSRQALNAAAKAASVHLTERRSEFESKVLLMAAAHGMGTPVLPSDVALQFDANGLLGGGCAEKKKWIPLVNKDGQRLWYWVSATTRPGDDDAKKFVDHLKAAARKLMIDHGRGEAVDLDSAPEWIQDQFEYPRKKVVVGGYTSDAEGRVLTILTGQFITATRFEYLGAANAIPRGATGADKRIGGLIAALNLIKQDDSPFSSSSDIGGKNFTWVKPERVIEIEYEHEVTGRHGFTRGYVLRPDGSEARTVRW